MASLRFAVGDFGVIGRIGHRWRFALLAAALVALPQALSQPAGAQPVEELPEYLQALGYLAWDEDAEVDKQGVVRFERERAAPGYNLYTNDRDQVLLIDLAGKRVHDWRIPPNLFEGPAQQCEYALLLQDGQLAVVCAKQGFAVLDWDSRPTYGALGFFHHDVVELPDGRLLAPARTVQTDYAGREVAFDGLMLISRNGRAREAWSSYAHLSELQEIHPPSLLDTPPEPGTSSKKIHDYYHLNAIQLLPESALGRRDSRFRAGNWLVSLRNANLLLILDRDRQSVVWSYGPGVLELQHAPTMLPSGNILIFDNGTHRGYTRVLELKPNTGAIAWEYRGRPPESFFSKWRGSAQRLPNGNTLITESERGHVFEVTHAGEIVWEFWNPEIEDGKRKRIYRMMRLSPDRVRSRLKPEAPTPPLDRQPQG